MEQENNSRHFVIDTDWGLDDSLAIIIALARLKVDAVTCVSGNVEIDKVVVNVSKVLQVWDVKIPIQSIVEKVKSINCKSKI